MDLDNLNETLQEMREIAARENSRTGYVDPGDALDDLESLSAMFGELDRWLSRGGALPDAWSRDAVERAVANSI